MFTLKKCTCNRRKLRINLPKRDVFPFVKRDWVQGAINKGLLLKEEDKSGVRGGEEERINYKYGANEIIIPKPDDEEDNTDD